jgi:hypothetical protein
MHVAFQGEEWIHATDLTSMKNGLARGYASRLVVSMER